MKVVYLENGEKEKLSDGGISNIELCGVTPIEPIFPGRWRQVEPECFHSEALLDLCEAIDELRCPE